MAKVSPEGSITYKPFFRAWIFALLLKTTPAIAFKYLRLSSCKSA
jgi:hypothetical protein